jgi:hypothetical protein
LRKLGLVAALVVTFVVLMPLSIRLVDPLWTHAFNRDWQHPVLLVWPDHVEVQWFRDPSEVTPLRLGVNCTFNVSPERQEWVEKTVRNMPSPNGNAAWIIHVRQMGPSRQRIQLELLGDGISGIIYEADTSQIVPLYSRLTGPGGAFVILIANVLLWGIFWLLLLVAFRLLKPARQRIAL